MIFYPAILALFAGSVFVNIMVLYSASHAAQILRNWDLNSGSELQLSLERKTYLISTLLTYAFAFEILSFFLYIFTADRLHGFFVGAMCAAGSLFVNSYGYPTLIVKLINLLLAGVWLIINYADNLGFDYPLIKKKYALFIFFVPFVVLETVLQANYFLRLDPNIITSCCGTLFSADNYALTSEIASLTDIPMKTIFYGVMVTSIGAGLFYYKTEEAGYFLSAMSGLALLVSIASILSFVSSYIYELPTHHCPFCMLQKEYGYIGYPIYAAVLGGAILGISVGVLVPFRTIPSLAGRLPLVQKRFALGSSILFFSLAVIVMIRIFLSCLVMEGH